MKLFNLQRQLLGFLLLGTQLSSSHNLPEAWPSPLSCLAPGAGGSGGAQMWWWWALPLLSALQITLCFSASHEDDSCAGGKLGHLPPLAILHHGGDDMAPLSTKLLETPWDLTGLSGQHPFPPKCKACWHSEGDCASARVWALPGNLGAVWLSMAGKLWCKRAAGFHHCCQVLPATFQSSVTCSLLFLLLFDTWGSALCSGYVQVSRPLPQQSPSAGTWASLSEPWKI